MNEQNSEKIEDSERLSFLLNFFIVGRDGSVAISSKLVTLLSLLKDDKDIKLTPKEYLTSLIDKAINKDKSARRSKGIKSLIKYANKLKW